MFKNITQYFAEIEKTLKDTSLSSYNKSANLRDLSWGLKDRFYSASAEEWQEAPESKIRDFFIEDECTALQGFFNKLKEYASPDKIKEKVLFLQNYIPPRHLLTNLSYYNFDVDCAIILKKYATNEFGNQVSLAYNTHSKYDSTLKKIISGRNIALFKQWIDLADDDVDSNQTVLRVVCHYNNNLYFMEKLEYLLKNKTIVRTEKEKKEVIPNCLGILRNSYLNYKTKFKERIPPQIEEPIKLLMEKFGAKEFEKYASKTSTGTDFKELIEVAILRHQAQNNNTKKIKML